MKIASVRRLYRRIRNKKEDAASDAISGDTHNALRFCGRLRCLVFFLSEFAAL